VYNDFDIDFCTIFGPNIAHFPAPRPLSRAVHYALIIAHADRELIGAWNLMLSVYLPTNSGL